MPISTVTRFPVVCPTDELNLMPSQYDDIKHDVLEIKDTLQRLITLHEVSRKDHEYTQDAVKRAFKQIDKLEQKMEELGASQLKSAWVTHVATAGLTGVGTALAMVVMRLGA